MTDIDWLAVLDTRWFIIIAIVALMIGYIILMDFRRFLAIVCMNIVFVFMWEGIGLGRSFPFSPVYVMEDGTEFMIGTIPASILFIKGVIYATGSYLVASMACREITHSKIDLVKNRGNRVNEHIVAGLLASFVYAMAVVIIDPILANGELLPLGAYENFINGVYFGVNPLYLLCSVGTSAISFLVIAIIDSAIHTDPEHVLFEYDRTIQAPRSYHQFAFCAFWASMIIPALLSAFISPVLATINIVIVLPITTIMIAMIWRASSMKDRSMVHEFCDGHPDSFICKM